MQRGRGVRWPLLAVAALAVLVPAPADAAFPGSNGRIAFDVITPGNTARRGIFSVRPGGEDPVRLRTSRADRWPAYSPDGRSIAFNCDQHLCVMPSDGGPATVVVSNPNLNVWEPAWSRDGQRIFFNGYENRGLHQNFDIFSVHVDGSGLRRVTGGPAEDSAPTVSPRTNSLVFERGGELYSVRPDGSSLRRLTRDGRRIIQWLPDFSPNGRRIVYVQQRAGGVGTPALRTMRPNGSGQRTLLHDRGAQPGQPAWSPDGQRIAFVDEGGVGSEVHVIPATGTRRQIARRVRVVVDWPGSLVQDPTWQAR